MIKNNHNPQNASLHTMEMKSEPMIRKPHNSDFIHNNTENISNI